MATVEQEAAEDVKGGRDLAWFAETFRESIDWLDPQRILTVRDYEWYHNYDDTQWDEAEKAKLRGRGQPIVTANRIKPKINFDMGLEQRSRTDPRALPRNPSDEQAASIATDVLDYVDTNTLFDSTASESFRDLLVGGVEVAEVVVDENHEIEINQIKTENFFFDPRSKMHDFTDANYMGYSQWFDLDVAEDIYTKPEQREFLQETLANSPVTGVGEDKPSVGIFGDREDKRVRVVIIYYKMDLEWRYAHFTGSGVLIEGPSFYLDEDGKPDNAITAQSAFVTLENERYGSVRDMISPQRQINYRTSKSLNLSANQRVWQANESVFPDKEAAREQLARADGILTANGPMGQAWGTIDSTAEVAENMAFLQEAKGEIGVQGPNDALQGRGAPSQSGIAIERQQLSGVTQGNNLFDNHNNWKTRIYRAIWARVKQFWTEDRFVRVTDEENAFRFAHVNVLATPANQIKMLPEEQQQAALEALAQRGITPTDPRMNTPQMTVQQNPETGALEQVPAMFNKLAEMDVDINIVAVPDSLSLQHSEFEQLIAFAQGGVAIPPRVMIMASNLQNKDKLLQAMDEEAAANAELQKEVAQIEFAGKAADIQNTEADTAKKASEIDLNKAKTLETVEDTLDKRLGEAVQ